MKKETTYFKGDLAEYTGKIFEIHGGTFYEVRMLEGFKRGELKVVSEQYKNMGKSSNV